MNVLKSLKTTISDMKYNYMRMKIDDKMNENEKIRPLKQKNSKILK